MVALFYLCIVLASAGMGYVLGFEEGRAYEKERRKC